MLRRWSGSLVLTAVLSLVGAAGLTACSSEDLAPVDASDAPADADPQAFCDAYGLDDVTAGTSGGDLADLLHEHAGDLADVGTPGDIPDAAREGFVVWVRATSTAEGDDLDDAAATGGLLDPARTLRVEGQDAGTLVAFLRYVTGTCFAGSP